MQVRDEMSEKKKNNSETFVFKVSFMMLLMLQKTIALHHSEVGGTWTVRTGQAREVRTILDE